MKYINFKELGIIIFPDDIEHIRMAKVIGRKALSAGFVKCKEPECFGVSGSLHIESDPEDSLILTKLMRH